MEIVEGGTGSDTLVLANPITKGVAKVKGATVGGPERDVDGLAESEVGNMIEAWAVLLAEGGGNGDCSLEA